MPAMLFNSFLESRMVLARAASTSMQPARLQLLASRRLHPPSPSLQHLRSQLRAMTRLQCFLGFKLVFSGKGHGKIL